MLTCTRTARKIGVCPSFKDHFLSRRVEPYDTIRNFFGAPQVLSSFALDANTFVQRLAVQLPSGERAVLTFTLGSEEEIKPQFRSMGVRHRWVLRSIKGEPDHMGDTPTQPNPALSPELVVEAQLRALQDGDFASVFAFASPANKVRLLPNPAPRTASTLSTTCAEP